MKHYSTGVMFILFSATGLAITGLLGKIGFQSLTLPALVFWRFFSAFICSFLLLLFWGKLKGGITLSHFKLHFLRAFFLLSSQYSFYYFLSHNSLLNAVALLNTGPLFIPLIEKVLTNHKMGKAAWIGLLISFLGVICILQPDADIFSWVSFMGLFAGVCQGASQVVFGISSTKERADHAVLFLFLLCTSISLIPYGFSETTFVVNSLSSSSISLLILGLGLASILNQFCRGEAYKHGTPSKLAAFLYFSVILAGLFDWVFFGDLPNELSIVGAALVILGGCVKIYAHFRENRSVG